MLEELQFIFQIALNYNIMVQLKFAIVATILAFMVSVDAHPNHQQSFKDEEASRAFKLQALRSLKACEHSTQARRLQQRTAERREMQLRQLREAALNRRRLSADDVVAKSHKSNLTGITSFDTANNTQLFGSSPKCVLEPDVTQGPYYVKGELIRNDVRETQAGIDLFADIQVIDINTCEPVSALYLDFWHCNFTGVYAGVVASGNGDSSDASNINATFHRGLAPTDEDGIVHFTTKFPGYYTGRAVHIHVLGNHGGQVAANNTYIGSTVSNVGQLFFDQDLITQVAATGTYANSSQQLTLNANDSIFQQAAAAGFDPIMEYVFVGDSIEDGIFAWISIGINASVSKSVSSAAFLTANGGVSTSGGAGGPSGGSSNGPGSNGSGRPGDMNSTYAPNTTGNMTTASPSATATISTVAPSSSSISKSTYSVLLCCSILLLVWSS
ncbi:hypothetical protein AC1031_008523 [Aphanomyces cochlioides]|nr:hypothetical protein AC1031_008523 [Aphanomyces cochlioides]